MTSSNAKATAPINPELRAFLADWLAWVERGAPHGEPYGRRYGLCKAVLNFGNMRLMDELQEAFRADGLDSDFPFGKFDYHRAARTATMHQDPNRLAWVRAKLAEAQQ